MSTSAAGALAGHQASPTTCRTRPSRYHNDQGFDAWMRALLRVPAAPQRVAGEAVYRTFSTGMVLSGLRCLLTYVLLPVISPVIGLATGVAPIVGIPVALLALVFDVIGVRRFWLADHRYRREMTAVYAAVMAMVMSLLILDLVHLAS